MNFLHTFNPEPILISFGSINIYWYGLFIVLGVIAAMLTTIKLAPFFNVSKDTIIDLAFYLIVFGIIGARFYDVLLELPYYLKYPIEIFKLWKGGLAIHGGIIAGALTVYFYTKTKNISFWTMSAIIVPGLALAQAIGRWGNYFNQELFGKPTDLPWAIPITIFNRPNGFLTYPYFHPTFLYESIGSFLIFLILLIIQFYNLKHQRLAEKYLKFSVFLYFISYSILRFALEFIRIDKAPIFFNLRWPQIISLVVIILSLVLLLKNYKKSVKVEA